MDSPDMRLYGSIVFVRHTSPSGRRTVEIPNHAVEIRSQRNFDHAFASDARLPNKHDLPNNIMAGLSNHMHSFVQGVRVGVNGLPAARTGVCGCQNICFVRSGAFSFEKGSSQFLAGSGPPTCLHNYSNRKKWVPYMLFIVTYECNVQPNSPFGF